MLQQRIDWYRDIGLAEQRYATPEELSSRSEVAKRIRQLAGLNRSTWKLQGWDGIRRRQASLIRQADRYESCRTNYTKIECSSCGQLLIGSQRCETRICESCSKKYAARIRQKQMKIAKNLQPMNGRRPMFLTLTKKTHPLYRPNTTDARHLFANARKLINTYWPRKEGCGALAVLEIGSQSNLHIHALVYGYYVPQDAISKLWHKLTGDSHIVHIKEIRGTRTHLNYLLKYISKPPKFKHPKQTADYLDLMLGLRRIRTYGIFYNYPLARKDSCPCPFCAGKLRFLGFEPGTRIRKNALFFEEAFEIAKELVN